MCTGIRLDCANGYVSGRTAEFGALLEYQVLFLPVGTALSTPLGKNTGKSWTSTRATLGTATFGALSVMDGINDAGLAAAAFYFVGHANYADATQIQTRFAGIESRDIVDANVKGNAAVCR